MNTLPPVGHVLFDMDGLLLDTEIIYTQVTQQIVSRYGKTFDWSIKSNMIGRPAIESAQYLVEVLDLPFSARDYLLERNELLKAAFPGCKALPGAEELIRHLSAHNIPIALATSSDQDLYEIKTQHHRSWFDLFDAVITGDDPLIGKGKPAPDIYLLAAKSLGGSAQSSLVFEDAPSGLAAGKAAQMRVVVVPDANMQRSRYHDADLILESLEDLDLTDFGLPARR